MGAGEGAGFTGQRHVALAPGPLPQDILPSSLNVFPRRQVKIIKRTNQSFGEGRVVNGRRRFWGWRLVKQGVILTLLALSLVTGCATQPYNPYMYTGAGLGAALGAGLGAAVNHSNPWRGAAIGALMGGALGGVGGEIYGRNNPLPSQSQSSGYYQPQPPPPGYYQSRPYYGQQPYSPPPG